MKKRLALVLIALAPGSVFAVPVNYTFEFSPFDTDPDGGIGSLYWDADTHSLSNLTWDFGEGRVGGIIDSSATWSRSAHGGTVAEFTFAVLSGEDVHPSHCGILVGCIVNFPLASGLGSMDGYPYGMQFTLFAGGSRTFSIYDGDSSHGGTIPRAASAVAVAEPGTWALLMSGLAGLVLLRRKRGYG